jgi:translation initiation factor 4E
MESAPVVTSEAAPAPAAAAPTTAASVDVGQMENSSLWTKDPNEHALQTAWSFWYDKKQSKKSDSAEFYSRLTKLGSFDTVESFWKMYLYMKRPSALDVNVNLYLFRDGKHIAPMWEAFPRGGCWILKIKKRKDSGASVLGKMWNDLVIATIGECFEDPDVVGVSVCIRKSGKFRSLFPNGLYSPLLLTEDLISVWNVDNRNDEIRFRIGEKMKQILDLEPSTVLEYKHHAVSMQDMSTFRNAKAYVFAADTTENTSA